LCARLNSRRAKTSLNVLTAVDSFGYLSFARREFTDNSTNDFVETLKTVR